MTINELIQIEEKLLYVETNQKFNMDFDEYLLLIKTLKEIGEITHQYFTLMKEYDIYLKTQDINLDERRKLLTEFNNKTLNTNVQISIPNFNIKQ